MKLLRNNGDPVKISSGDVFGFKGDSIDYSPENNYGDGAAEMRPDMLLEALLAPKALAKIGSSGAKSLMKNLFKESATKAGESSVMNSISQLLGGQ